jgi:ubiquitin-protein ligase
MTHIYTNSRTEDWKTIHTSKKEKFVFLRRIASFVWAVKDIKNKRHVWRVSMKSHPFSPYKDAIWILEIEFPKIEGQLMYPFRPPKVTIRSPLNRFLKKAYVVLSSLSLSPCFSIYAMANSYNIVLFTYTVSALYT